MKANKRQLWQWGLTLLVMLLLDLTARQPVEAEVLTLFQLVRALGYMALTIVILKTSWTSIFAIDAEIDIAANLSLSISNLLKWSLFLKIQLWLIGQWSDGIYQWWVARPQQSAVIVTIVGLMIPFLMGVKGYAVVQRLLRGIDQRQHRPDSIIRSAEFTPLPILIQIHDPLCCQCKYKSGTVSVVCAVNPMHQMYESCSEFEQGNRT